MKVKRGKYKNLKEEMDRREKGKRGKEEESLGGLRTGEERKMLIEKIAKSPPKKNKKKRSKKEILKGKK